MEKKEKSNNFLFVWIMRLIFLISSELKNVVGSCCFSSEFFFNFE